MANSGRRLRKDWRLHKNTSGEIPLPATSTYVGHFTLTDFQYS